MNVPFKDGNINPCYVDENLTIAYSCIQHIENPAVVIRPTKRWRDTHIGAERPGYPVILKPHSFLYRFSDGTWELYHDVKTDWEACELVRIYTRLKIEHYIACRPGNLPYTGIIGAHYYYYEGELTTWDGTLRFPNMYYGDLVETIDPYYKDPPQQKYGYTGHFDIEDDYEPSKTEVLYGEAKDDSGGFQRQRRLNHRKHQQWEKLHQSQNLVKSPAI